MIRPIGDGYRIGTIAPGIRRCALFRQETPGDWVAFFVALPMNCMTFPVKNNWQHSLLHLTLPPGPFRSTSGNSVLIETSIGELADKITILQIKSVKMTDPAKLAHVQCELDTLTVTFEAALKTMLESPSSFTELVEVVSRLKQVNETLWQVEDDIRDCERMKDFGPRFVELARSVYFENDRRAALKRQINELLGSRIVEEKSYTNYNEPNHAGRWHSSEPMTLSTDLLP